MTWQTIATLGKNKNGIYPYPRRYTMLSNKALRRVTAIREQLLANMQGEDASRQVETVLRQLRAVDLGQDKVFVGVYDSALKHSVVAMTMKELHALARTQLATMATQVAFERRVGYAYGAMVTEHGMVSCLEVAFGVQEELPLQFLAAVPLDPEGIVQYAVAYTKDFVTLLSVPFGESADHSLCGVVYQRAKDLGVDVTHTWGILREQEVPDNSL